MGGVNLFFGLMFAQLAQLLKCLSRGSIKFSTDFVGVSYVEQSCQTI